MSIKKRVTKEQWLSAALEALLEGGIENVKVEKLARQLNISKSGFYWHFKNRRDLLKEIIGYWSREYTEVIAGNIELKALNPKERLFKIMQTIQDYSLARYDTAMRAWALSDKEAYKAVKNVYKIRHDYIKGIFSELGFQGDDLEMRTRLFVVYHSWEMAMYDDSSRTNLNKLLKLRLELLTKR